MGLSIKQSEFTAEEFDRFSAKVRTDLTALTRLLDRPGFGEGASSIGAEVEFYIVNPNLRVQPINTDIAASVQDPQLTVELNRFNLEYNLSPQAFKGAPFARTEQELLKAMLRINQHAAPLRLLWPATRPACSATTSGTKPVSHYSNNPSTAARPTTEPGNTRHGSITATAGHAAPGSCLPPRPPCIRPSCH